MLLVIIVATVIIGGFSSIAILLGFEAPVIRHGGLGFFGHYFPFWSIPLYAAIGFAGGSIAYYIILPEITPRTEVESGIMTNPLDAVLRVLEPDERKLVEALKEAGGRMLQKEATRKVGFTRVKSHRVVARLAKRGVITVEKLGSGKTNQIALSSWLYQTLSSEGLTIETIKEISAK